MSLPLLSAIIAPASAEPTASYFLSQDGYLTPAKDQGGLGTCWTFSNSTTLESTLLRQGIITDLNSPLLNISEWHLATANGNITVLTPSENDGEWSYDGWGGYNEYAVGYWTRGMGAWELDPRYDTTQAGGGPVLEQTHPLNRYPFEEAEKLLDLSPYVPPAAQDVAPYQIKQSITFSWDGDLNSLADFQQSLKQGILDYGGISVMMYVSDDFEIDTTQEGYIYDGNNDPNHAISLVGWDDSKELTIGGVTYTGGWLLQNSWGDDWGTLDPITQEGGYFWIPFADTSKANIKEGLTFVVRNNLYLDGTREYSPIVTQNQIFSPFVEDPAREDLDLYIAGFDAGETTLAAQKLTAPRGPRESTLAAISLWQPYAGLTVSISIYDGWDENGPTGNLLAQKTATLNGDGVGGYNEIDLDTPITLSLGQDFYVVVDYGDLYDYPVTVDPRTPREFAGDLDFSGLSWISTNGSTWYDLFTDMELPSIMFMKGIMIFYHLGADGLVADAMQTRGTFEVGDLHFLGGSELYLNGPLLLGNGRITFDAGISDLKNQMVSTPGDLNIEGDGTLNIESIVLAGGTADIQRGHVNITAPFTVGGNFVTIGTTVLRGAAEDIFAGILTTQNVTVQSGGELMVEEHGSIALNNNGTSPIITTTPGTLTNYGWLTGTGTIVANVTNHGVLSPGHSPGTITVIGNYTQASGATYFWEAAGKEYDRLVVHGDATLHGTLAIVTPLEYGRFYSKVVSADAVHGAFETIETPEGYRLRLVAKPSSFGFAAAPESYTQVAGNENQRHVARALDRFIPATKGDREAVAIALDRLSLDEYSDAFNAIMPGSYEATESIGLSLSTSLGQLLSQRLDAVRHGSTGLSVQGFGALPVYSKGDGKTETAGNILVPSPENRWGLWLQGNGIFGRSNSIADIPGYRFNSGGALVGLDYRWSDTVASGLFAGYQGAAANNDDGEKVRMNSSNFGLYASYACEGGLYGSAIAMSSFSDFEVRRQIRFSTIDRVARGSFPTWTGSILLENGYDFQIRSLRYGPLVNLQYTHISRDAFEETQAESLNLKLDRHETDSLQSNIGGRVANTWRLSEEVAITPEVRVFWNHEYLHSPSTYHAAFRSGGSFDYHTTAPSRDSVTTGAAIFWRLGERWSATTSYNANFANGTTTTHSIAASAEFRF